MDTEEPIGPKFGDKLEIIGVDEGGADPTVSVVEPQMEPVQAVIVAMPVAIPTAGPKKGS
jgi:hypothetical protein